MSSEIVRLSPWSPLERSLRHRAKPHDSATLEQVRVLIETTTLSYRAIQARTGVPRATISHHVLGQGWLRPGADGAPLPPSRAAKRRARRGELAESVLLAAERRVNQLEMNPTASPRAFEAAARLIALAESLDRPSQPRNRRPRARRMRKARTEPLPLRPEA